jgi:hypothetical protein
MEALMKSRGLRGSADRPDLDSGTNLDDILPALTQVLKS